MMLIKRKKEASYIKLVLKDSSVQKYITWKKMKTMIASIHPKTINTKTFFHFSSLFRKEAVASFLFRPLAEVIIRSNILAEYSQPIRMCRKQTYKH